MKTTYPSFEDRVKQHYLNASGETYHLEKRKLNPALIPWLAKLRAEKFSPYIKPQDHVFEYGAGAGWNLIGLNCQKKSAYDLSTLNVPTFQANSIQFINREDDIPSESYDVLLCHHVLEHVPSPGETLTFFRSLIKPNGKMVLVVPMEHQRIARFNLKDPDGHLYTWTPQTLGNLVDRAGFNVEAVSIQWEGYDRYAAELANRLHVGQIGFRILRKAAQFLGGYREVVLVGTPKN